VDEKRRPSHYFGDRMGHAVDVLVQVVEGALEERWRKGVRRLEAPMLMDDARR
jgi:hypothetical protein